MSMMECAMCHRIADARALCGCPVCGAMLCDDCTQREQGLCPECAAAERN